MEGSSSGEARGTRTHQSTKSGPGGGVKRKTPSAEAGSRSPATGPRRKRRARESSHRGGRGGRGRGVASDRITGGGADESEEAKDNTLSTIGSLDNDALTALAQRSPRSSKYNFFPDFDNTMDSNARIAIIQQNMKNLKKT